MGAADVVPGVSGGTIAFISGIYEELISSISKINLQALKVLTQEGIVAFWKYSNGSFFLALLMGIGISIKSSNNGMVILLWADGGKCAFFDERNRTLELW